MSMRAEIVSRWALVTSLACGVVACAAHSTAADVSAVREIVKERAALGVHALQARAPDEIAQDVRSLLAQPLSLDNAVRIALLNNRELRADLFGLGVARGQLVQADLFPNIEFDVAVRFPRGGDHPRAYDLGASLDLTHLILRGPRTDVAEAELDAARVRAAGAVLDLSYRVRLAYYDVQAGEQQLELLRTAMQSFGASFDTTRELQRAGNANELDVATEQSAYESARVVVAEAEAELIDARERLNVLLGVFGQATSWAVSPRLPDPSADLGDVSRLESRAIDASLELAATRSQLMASARRVGLSKIAGVLPDLSVGVSAERHEGLWFVGPQLSGNLPLFDRQQGNRISFEAELDALRERYLADAVNIRAAMRAARDRALSAQARLKQYRETLLPLRERVVQQSVLHYNAMQIGVFQLLSARREQVDAGRSYVATLLEYWRSRAALEQLLAGRMASTVATITSAPARSMTSRGGGGGGEGH
jgi:cobalt-zinc-cadmium efflux system outer membrane protein